MHTHERSGNRNRSHDTDIASADERGGEIVLVAGVGVAAGVLRSGAGLSVGSVGRQSLDAGPAFPANGPCRS
jgi:hypothetical protein